jgi:hypothetical protein
MKTLFFFSLLLITTISFAQPVPIKFDTTNFIKRGVKEVILDPSVTSKLEPFKDKDDAIIYCYRLSNFVGAAVKYLIDIDEKYIAYLGQKQYIVAHINTSEALHFITSENLIFKYIGFKPNRYYKIRQKGFTNIADYLDEKALAEIKTCKKIETSVK